MNYHVTVKEVRMRATQQALNSAVMELLVGQRVCAQFQLERVSAVVLGDMLMFVGFPMLARAQITGRITSGRVLGKDGTALVTDMSVGLTGTKADVTLEKVDAAEGNLVRLETAEIRHA